MNHHTLTPSDIAGLSQSYLTPELAAAAGIFRVDGIEGALQVGRDHQTGNYAGLIFPYFWPGESRSRFHRLRRDVPDRVFKHGRWKDENKYLSAPGSRNRFYFPPATAVSDLTDSSVPICFVEGEKKCLALSRYFTGKNERMLPVGIAGVWAWRGRVGREPGPNPGEWLDVKGPIPDFDRIVWAGRRVVILFDANVNSNSSVRAARAHLAAELVHRGAVVELIDLPDLPNVNGVDDLLALYGSREADEVFLSAYPASSSLTRAKSKPPVTEADRMAIRRFWLELKRTGAAA